MKELTRAQKRAITATDRSMAVIAGAGSGKTTVLINRCLEIINKGHAPEASATGQAELDRILAITFTEKAAAELKQRLRHKLPQTAHHRLATAWVGTFHGVCARMVRQHAPLLGLDPSFAILDENASQLLMRQAVRTSLLAGLSARDEQVVLLVDEMDFRNAAQLMEDLMAFRWHARLALKKPKSDDEREDRLLKASAHAYGLCEKAFYDSLASEDALDFQELEIAALNLLDDHKDVLNSYQKRFRHILVDEYQDTNDVQTELTLRLFAPGKNTLCIVGDPRQSIYRFRGANVDCVQTALDHIRRADGEVVQLTDNFRSHPDVVSFVNTASEHIEESPGKAPKKQHLTPARTKLKDAPAVMALDLANADKLSAAERRRFEAQSIASTIEKLIAEHGYSMGDIVCLFQALTDVAEYEAAFKERGIPYRFFGGRGLLSRQEVCDMMHVLRFALNPYDQIATLGLLRSPMIGLSDEDILQLGGNKGVDLCENARKHPDCSLLRKLANAGEHRRPSEIMRMMVDETAYEHICGELDPSGGMRAALDRLIILAESVERQAPTTLKEFIDFVANLRERNARLGDPPAAGDGSQAVHCMTVHTAKGLEFPVVILPDLFRQERNATHPWVFHRQEGLAFKLKDLEHPFGKREPSERFERIAEIEKFQSAAEHARLLYVAMTRAEDTLVLPLHRDEKVRGRWHEWLKPLADNSITKVAFKHENNSIPERTIVRSCDSAIVKTFDRTSVQSHYRTIARIFSVSQLEEYDRCPFEYYLRHQLGLPANRLISEESADLPSNIKGSIIHGVMENLSKENSHLLDELVRSQCTALDVQPTDKTIIELKRPIEHFMKTPLFEQSGEGSRECRIDWRLDGHTITGYIDWYREDEDGIHILDYKASRVTDDQVSGEAARYELQLATYALALEEAFGKPAVSTTLIFLADDATRLHEKKLDTKMKYDMKDRLCDIMKSISSESFDLSPAANPPCTRCPYHHNGLCWEDKYKAEIRDKR